MPALRCSANCAAEVSSTDHYLAHPDVHYLERSRDHLVLEFYLRPDLVLFEDHFDGFPVLPGVVQLHWVFALGEDLTPEYSSYVVRGLKFNSPMVPSNRYRLELELQRSRLRFEYSLDGQPITQGSVGFER